MGVFCQQNTYPNVNEPIKNRQDVIGPDTPTGCRTDQKFRGKCVPLLIFRDRKS